MVKKYVNSIGGGPGCTPKKDLYPTITMAPMIIPNKKPCGFRVEEIGGMVGVHGFRQRSILTKMQEVYKTMGCQWVLNQNWKMCNLGTKKMNGTQ